MKDIVAKITNVWNDLKDYLFGFIGNFLGAKDNDLLGKIKELIEKAIGTADVVADQVEEAE